MSEERKPYRIEGRTPTIYRVVKNKDNPYVMIDRRPVDNPALSFKAKGILTYLLSRPDGWEVSVADLIKHGADGEGAVRSGLKELKLAGHMKYTKSRNQGRITGWLIEVFEVPQSPDRDFQDVDNPDVENRGQVLSTLSNTEKPISRVKKEKKMDVLGFMALSEKLKVKNSIDKIEELLCEIEKGLHVNVARSTNNQAVAKRIIKDGRPFGQWLTWCISDEWRAAHLYHYADLEKIWRDYPQGFVENEPANSIPEHLLAY